MLANYLPGPLPPWWVQNYMGIVGLGGTRWLNTQTQYWGYTQSAYPNLVNIVNAPSLLGGPSDSTHIWYDPSTFPIDATTVVEGACCLQQNDAGTCTSTLPEPFGWEVQEEVYAAVVHFGLQGMDNVIIMIFRPPGSSFPCHAAGYHYALSADNNYGIPWYLNDGTPCMTDDDCNTLSDGWGQLCQNSICVNVAYPTPYVEIGYPFPPSAPLSFSVNVVPTQTIDHEFVETIWSFGLARSAA